MIDDKNNLPELPKGWVWAKLGEIIEASDEKVNPKAIQEVAYIGLEHIEKNTGKLLDHGNSSEVRSTKTRFHKGDLLYGKLRPYLNKVYVADFNGICSTDILVFSKTPDVSNKYIAFRLLCSDFVLYASQNVSGVQHPRVNFNTLSQFLIPLPPLAEQHRIVAKIEELFTKLDAGVESLKKAKAQLKRYRQSVLKAAVEGKLTKEWREAHKGELEPASVLLERILRERREKWEAEQLAQMKSKGKMPKDDSWKKKYKEPVYPDTSDLPEVPDGWTWATLSQLGELNRGKSKHRPRNAPHLYSGPYPFVQTGDIRHATGVLRQYNHTYSEEGLKQSRLWPEGTLCITIAANIADTAILGFDACFPDSMVGFLAKPSHCNIRYVELFMRTAKEGLERYAPATAQKNINLRILSEVAIPLPPLLEQYKIVEEIERRFSIIEEVETVIEANFKRAKRLRQSILKQAFSGKLVPQDANDKPASVLLERIEKGKVRKESKKKSTKRSKKSKAKKNEKQLRLL